MSREDHPAIRTKRMAIEGIRKREYFRIIGLAGHYPYDAIHDMTYIVKSRGDQIIAVFDGDTWHILDSDFVSEATKGHIALVKEAIGTNDAYSEYPVVPTLASMDALIKRLGIKEL